MEQLERHLITAFDAPDGIRKLRELILTLAMQGRIVPQGTNDQPASELLKEIETEKKRLVKQGKIKEFYPILALRSEDAPYNLPDGWEWVKLGLIALIERGGSPRPINAFLTHEQDGLNWIKIGDTQKGGKFITATSEKIRPEGLSKTRMVYPGDFLLTNSMSFGRPYITQIEGCIHDGWLRISPPESVNKDYLYHLLSSSFVRTLFETAAAGAVVQNLNADKVRELPIPLPPLNEQTRIVAKIDELMARCDALEKLRAERDAKRLAVHTAAVRQLLNVADTDGHIQAREFLGQHFGELYTVKENVTGLRKAILQLAVMGKLVPQNHNDPPASELLKQIEAEKMRLVKAGKIKVPNQLLLVSPEGMPYSLPKGWEWCRLEDVTIKIHYGYTASADHDAIGVRLLRITDIQDNAVNWESVPGCDAEKEEVQQYLLGEGDILIARTGGTIGKSYLVQGLNLDAVFASYLIRAIPSTHIDVNYLKRFMESPIYWSQLYAASSGTGQPNVNGTSLSQLIVPLPSPSEQHRIVAKIDQLMFMCDTLEQQIDAAGATQSALLAAMMAQYGGQRCA